MLSTVDTLLIEATEIVAAARRFEGEFLRALDVYRIEHDIAPGDPREDDSFAAVASATGWAQFVHAAPTWLVEAL